jgi:hypothetical protein
MTPPRLACWQKIAIGGAAGLLSGTSFAALAGMLGGPAGWGVAALFAIAGMLGGWIWSAAASAASDDAEIAYLERFAASLPAA